MQFKLSPTALKLMQECPRCFWLAQHKVWTRPEGITASLMNGMDKVLKKHFDNFMENGKLPPELLKSECKEGCKLFSDAELLRVWRNNLKGISWTDEEGNTLHGAVDNILVKKNKLIVLDYKTRGFPLKENTHEYYQNQLDIYNFLLKMNGYETEDFAFLLFYYPKEVLPSGEIIFENQLIKMPVDIKNAEALWKKAIKLLNSKCPEECCEWCELVREK